MTRGCVPESALAITPDLEALLSLIVTSVSSPVITIALLILLGSFPE